MAEDPTHVSRWVELAGAHNVRDLGGLPAAGDRRIRPGVLFRGDHLDDVTEADLAVLRDAVGLRAIVDLRAAREAPVPAAWLGSLGVARLHLPLVDLGGTTDRSQLREEFRNDIAGAYERMLDIFAPNLVPILEFLVEGGHTPALVHCAAGKDRTGITVAVLMAAAGVEEPGIVADYVATGERLDRIRAALARHEPYRHLKDDAGPEFGVFSAAIERVLAIVGSHEGGAPGYLVAHGADPRTLAAWQEMLLEPAI
jgi:protein-tyrosine phosphatase